MSRNHICHFCGVNHMAKSNNGIIADRRAIHHSNRCDEHSIGCYICFIEEAESKEEALEEFLGGVGLNDLHDASFISFEEIQDIYHCQLLIMAKNPELEKGRKYWIKYGNELKKGFNALIEKKQGWLKEKIADLNSSVDYLESEKI